MTKTYITVDEFLIKDRTRYRIAMALYNLIGIKCGSIPPLTYAMADAAVEVKRQHLLKHFPKGVPQYD